MITALFKMCNVQLRVQFVLSRKQYTSSVASAISHVQFVISRKITDTKTLGIDREWDILLEYLICDKTLKGGHNAEMGIKH